jgi:transcriptional regulator with XRE-family HTH domain
MKQFAYRERDYAFGQMMLTLRTTIGLTQEGLSDLLGVSRRAVGEWEQGSSYPKAEHLKQFIALAVEHQAFSSGREAEEIRTLWRATHQKVLLDELWLSAVVGCSLPHLELVAPRPSTSVPTRPSGPACAAAGPRVDWSDALDVSSFYDRVQEQATLSCWVLEEGCRLVSVLGMGGIGKTALVVRMMKRLAEHFDVVLFRSLRDAPSCEALLEQCLPVLAPQSLDVEAADPSTSSGQALDRRTSLLLEALREQRVLLVLDNLEALLLEGDVRGQLRPGYEGYSRLLQAVAGRAHQSCVLLTSREIPAALRALEGRKTAVRSLRLAGLEVAACEQLLVSHELLGSPEERVRLVERYGGNPLALHIVAETIAELFGGQIAAFLAQETLVFGSISDLLDEQVGRLSAQEQTLLSWLAIAREPVTFEELRALLVGRLSPVQVLEAVDGLRRRSLIEQGQRPGSFTLHAVVLEYVTGNLVEQPAGEIVQGWSALAPLQAVDCI